MITKLAHDVLFPRHLAGEFRGSFPIALVGRGLADQLGAVARVLRLWAETAAKQAKHRLQSSDYALVQEILTRGESLREGKRSTVFLAEIGGPLWKLALKSTRDGRELYLTSLHRSNQRQLRKLRRG